MLLFLWTKFPEAGTEGQAFLMSTGVTQTLSKRLQTLHILQGLSLSCMLCPLVGVKWCTVTWTCTCKYQQVCTQLVWLLKLRSLVCELPPQPLRPSWLWVSPRYTPKTDMILFLDLYFLFFTFKPLIHPSILYSRGSILWSFQMNPHLLAEFSFPITSVSMLLCFYGVFYPTDLLVCFQAIP